MSLLPICNDIEQIFKIIYKACEKQSDADMSVLDIVHLIKSLVRILLINSDEMDSQKSVRINELKQHLIDIECEQFSKKITQRNYFEEFQFSQFQRLVNVRNILQEYYIHQYTDITFQQLLNEFKRIADFGVSDDCLKHWLVRLNFCLINEKLTNREIVIEKPHQRMERLKYLRVVQQHRKNKRNLVYFREAAIDISRCITAELNASNIKNEHILTVFYAASENGLVNFTFVESESITAESFIEWLTAVIGDQPAKSILLIEPHIYSYPNTPLLFTTEDNSIPSKPKIQKFIAQENIVSAEDEMWQYAIQMLDLSWKHCHNTQFKDTKSVMALYKSVNDLGHEILHLPFKHPELNPLHRIDFFNLVNNMEKCTFEGARDAIRNCLDQSTGDEWRHYFLDLIKIEEKYLKFEETIDDETIDLEECDYDDDDDSDIIVNFEKEY